METMKDANQFANVEKAAETVEAAPENLLPAVRIAQLEAQIADLTAKLAAADILAAKQAAEIEAQKKAMMEAATKDFRRGQEIMRLEKARAAAADRLDHAERAKMQAEQRAADHIKESDALKKQLIDEIATATDLRQRVETLEKRLQPAKGLEYDVLLRATPEDLRFAENDGWAIKHMQFEDGNLRVVLRRAKHQQPRDRKPAAAARAIPTRPIVPPVPARPAPKASADHIAGADEMVILGLDGDDGHDERRETGREASPTAISMVMQSFAANLQAHLAANPIPEPRPLSDLMSR